jgi:hypothetical protein
MSYESDILARNDRVSQLRDEVVRLFNEQTEFFRKGARAKHAEIEVTEYEKRRERIRRLFAELAELQEVASAATNAP